jgi:hypothetical protein
VEVGSSRAKRASQKTILTKLAKLAWLILGNNQAIMAMGFEMKAKATKLRVRGEPNGNV